MAEPKKNKIAIILLAAGSSSRMGQSKQLITMEGETLLEKSIKTALASKSKHVVVVLGAREAEHRFRIENFPIAIVSNPHWAKGMGSSLKAGLAFLNATAFEPEAVIVMVCDQPLLTSSHLDSLIDRYDATHTPIVASFYSGSAGVPALFDQSAFAALNGMGDEQGAKKIINSSKEFDIVLFPEGSMDLDTPEDVKRFFK